MKVLFCGYSQTKHVQALLESVDIKCCETHRGPFQNINRIINLWYLLKSDMVYRVGGKDIQNERLLRMALLLQKKVVIHWVGTDVLNICEDLKHNPRSINSNCINLAGSETLVQELSTVGIESTWIPIVPLGLHFTPLPAPKKHRVLSYIPEEKEDFYNIDLLKKLARYYPDIEFIVVANYGVNDHDKVQNIRYEGKVDTKRMKELYEECSVLFRYPMHDGLSMMVIEALGTGREVVYNYKFPYCYTPASESFQDIINCFDKVFSKKPETRYDAVTFVNDEFSMEKQITRYKRRGII